MLHFTFTRKNESRKYSTAIICIIMTSTTCSINAFTTLLRHHPKFSVKSLWSSSGEINKCRSLSCSSFNGKRFNSHITNHSRKIGLHAKSLSMWGESPTQKKFSTFDDDEPENSSSRKSKQGRLVQEDNEDPKYAKKVFRNSNKSSNGSGWDDFASDADKYSDYAPYEYGQKSKDSNGGNRRMSRRGGPSNKFRNDKRRDIEWDSRRTFKRKETRSRNEINVEYAERKVNIRALEKAGFDHLYGISPILNALAMNKRDFLLDEDSSETDRKPEAQFTPYLFLQNTYFREGSSSEIGGKKDDKVKAVREILRLVEKVGVPVEYVDKGVLNALSSNRPHQGLVLRCRTLDFTPLPKIPYPHEDNKSSPRLWLALDEVVDPQNFGALLRSAYFLGSTPSSSKIGVIVCAKNSSPASPTVSAASAGALEIMDIYSTNNLPRMLSSAVEDGWRVLGAAAEPLVLNSNRNIGSNNDRIIQCTNLTDLEFKKNQPTILVLGSEGHGLRTLVARACTELVRIPSGLDMGFGMSENHEINRRNSSAGVDSLNVSVSGAILLWSMINSLLK